MSDTTTSSSGHIILSKLNGVTTLTMNRPKRLNGWSLDFMDEIKSTFIDLAHDDETKVLVLTSGPLLLCGRQPGRLYEAWTPSKSFTT